MILEYTTVFFQGISRHETGEHNTRHVLLKQTNELCYTSRENILADVILINQHRPRHVITMHNHMLLGGIGIHCYNILYQSILNLIVGIYLHLQHEYTATPGQNTLVIYQYIMSGCINISLERIPKHINMSPHDGIMSQYYDKPSKCFCTLAHSVTIYQHLVREYINRFCQKILRFHQSRRREYINILRDSVRTYINIASLEFC